MSEFDPFAAMKARDGSLEPPPEFSAELYTTLRDSLDRHAVGAPPEPGPTTPRRGLAVAGVALASLLGLFAVLSWLSPADEPTAAVDPLPLSEPEDVTTFGPDHNPDPSVVSPPISEGVAPPTTVASPAGQNLGGYQFGGWSVLPASDFDGRRGAAVVWTGEQLIVWGGEVPTSASRPDEGWPLSADGGVYDPTTDIWFSLPPAPLSPRAGATALWSGTEMYVIGGSGPDGAAYDPQTRLWRELPLHTVPSNPAAVWTGSEVVMFGGHGRVGSAYNPSTNTWRDIAPLEQTPGHGDDWDNPRAVWTGSEMIVWNIILGGGSLVGDVPHALDIAAYDPQADSWRRLPPQPFDFELAFASGVWTGREVLLLGANFPRFAREGDYADVEPVAGIAFDPATNEWRMIDPPPFAEDLETEGFGLHASVWADDRLLIWAGGFLNPEPGPELWSYDPDRDMWERGASSPLPAADPHLLWTGDTLYAYGGDLGGALQRLLSLPLAAGEPLPPPVGAGATIELPVELPFEIFALEPFVQSAFIGDFANGTGRFYDREDTFLQRDAISQVVALGDGWMTSANGEIWWFPESISQLPIALQNEPESLPGGGSLGFSYFLPAGEGPLAQRIWSVVPGPGYADFSEPSVVRSISANSGAVRTYTEAPSDVFPVGASTTGLLLNGFEWLDTGDGFVEDPATREMMLVKPDGELMALWAGWGIDLSVNRVVWLDCDSSGAECSIVVSALSGPSTGDLRIEIPGLATTAGAVSPNGRWLIVGVGSQGQRDQALLQVDLTDGTFDVVFEGRTLGYFTRPIATWSADSEWIVSLDGTALALRVSDRTEVDLSQWIPDGMVVYGVASR